MDLNSIPPRTSLVHPADDVQSDAQRLYATAITSTSRPSVPIRSIVHGDTPLSPLSPAQAPPPSSVSEPEYRARRLQKSRYLPPLSMGEGLVNGQTLYSPAVQTSLSPTFKPQYDVRRGRRASLGISHPEGYDTFRRKALPPTPIDGQGSDGMIMISGTNQHTKLYSGITEDNVFIMPACGKVSSTEQRAIMIDQVPLSVASRKPIASPSFTRPTDQAILQPRPMKPIRGISTSFQEQIRETSPSREEDQLGSRARKTLLSIKAVIPDENIRPPQHDEDSSWTMLDPSLDQSFVIVDEEREEGSL